MLLFSVREQQVQTGSFTVGGLCSRLGSRTNCDTWIGLKASEFFVGTIFVKDSMMRALLLISLPAPVVEVFSLLLTYNAKTNVVEFYLKKVFKKIPSTIIVLLVKTSP